MYTALYVGGKINHRAYGIIRSRPDPLASVVRLLLPANLKLICNPIPAFVGNIVRDNELFLRAGAAMVPEPKTKWKLVFRVDFLIHYEKSIRSVCSGSGGC